MQATCIDGLFNIKKLTNKITEQKSACSLNSKVTVVFILDDAKPIKGLKIEFSLYKHLSCNLNDQWTYLQS